MHVSLKGYPLLWKNSHKVRSYYRQYLSAEDNHISNQSMKSPQPEKVLHKGHQERRKRGPDCSSEIQKAWLGLGVGGVGGWGLNLKERPGRQEVKGNSRKGAAPERTMVSCLKDFKHVTWEPRVSIVAESKTHPSQRDYSVQILGSEVVLKSYAQTCS